MTQAFATSLTHTKGLAVLERDQPSPGDYSHATSGLAYDQAGNLLRPSVAAPTKSLKDAIEDLFFNITISMASSPMFQYNASSPLAPSPVNVTFDLFGNIYTYHPARLWLGYGLAISVNCIIVAIGLFAMLDAGVSYNANFSTVLRIARNAEVSIDTNEEVPAGKSPLPKGIANANFNMPAHEPENEEAILLEILQRS